MIEQPPGEPSPPAARAPSGNASPARLADNRIRAAGWGVLGLLGAVLLVNVIWLADHWKQLRRVGPGQSAPDFRLLSSSGERVRLSDLRGKVVLIDFWSIRCGPCWTGLEHINRVAQDFPTDRVSVLAVHVDGGEKFRDRVMTALQDNRDKRPPLAFPILFDNGTVERRYTVRVLPTTVLIDKRGRVHKVWYGVTSHQTFAEKIRSLL